MVGIEQRCKCRELGGDRIRRDGLRQRQGGRDDTSSETNSETDRQADRRTVVSEAAVRTEWMDLQGWKIAALHRANVAGLTAKLQG